MKSSKKQRIDSELIERAHTIARTYRLILSPDNKGGFRGNAVELPFVLAKGRTAEDCLAMLEREIVHLVTTFLASGQTPPAASDCRRIAQINVRVLPEEKLALEEIAREEGFRSVSDLMRKLATEYRRQTT
jgi:predicted RNase H-like HicB family nuclease